jgi:Carboxymuconolactone decarboxylase family
MPAEFSHALENGVTPAELSEIITHLAFYAGWGPTRCPPSRWRRICAPSESGAPSARNEGQASCPCGDWFSSV